MYRKILLGGVTAAVILGAGGTALALSGSDTTPSGSSASGSSASGAKHDGKHAKHGKHGKAGRLLRHLDHGQFVTTGKDGTSVTHDLVRGTVTAVSASSVTVRAADKTSETFTVGKDTKIRERTAGTKSSDGTKTKGTRRDATIKDIAKGDHVLVLGTGATKYVATHIVEITK